VTDADRLASDATRAFFGPRASSWDVRFPNDGPAFERAVADLAPPPGGTALDVGCGTARAAPALRSAVGPGGIVVALDLTAEMLAVAVAQGRLGPARLVVADANRLPLRDGTAHAVLASGLLPHLSDPAQGLAELARATARGGRLAIFHPIGRAALAARHGSEPSNDDVLAAGRISSLLAASGWVLVELDDAQDRYLALACRTV